MEGESGDPYEEQLLEVFNSCLEKGQTELRAEGLGALCDKLELEERGKELISCLLRNDEKFVNFATFREGLLKLLGQNQSGARSFESKDATDRSSLNGRLGDKDLTELRLGSQVTEGQNSDVSPRKLNGIMNGEIDHSEMCGLAGIGYSTVPKEMLEQIFEKLDMDCDGLISFDEFILLFDNDKNSHEQLTCDWSNGSSNEVIKSRDSQNFVHILGPHQTGYARISTIISMWEVAGVSDAAALLSDLGFTSAEIRLADLTTVLCEELKNLRDEPDNAVTLTHLSLLKGALTLYQEEVRCMNNLVEHLSGERDKLRIDVAEANERANLLAQEIDEHHVRLEKSRQEQLKQLELRHAEITRDLSFQCTSEREAHTAALKELDRQLQIVQQEEQQVRNKLANVMHENQTLENEVDKLSDQVTKLKSTNGQLLIKVQQLAAEHEEIDTGSDNQETEQIIQLVERIKRLQEDMALLRDQNDELTTELEFTKNRTFDKKINDFDDTLKLESTKKLKNEIIDESIERSSSINWYKNNDDTKYDIDKIIREFKIQLNSKNQCTADYCHFRNNISKIIDTLEKTFSGITTTFNDDDNDIGPTRRLLAENEIECEERTSESLRDLVVCQTEKIKLVKCISHSDDTINIIDKNFNNLDAKSITKNKISLRDYPPRKDDLTIPEIVKNDRTNVQVGRNIDESTKENIDTRINDELNKHITEKKQLTDRCSELERSLDLLRAEYEQCEDYWAAKLEEERQIFEQEQKISDEKFSDLIAKMAEYEEQFGHSDKSRNDGRLSPIEEKFNLEQQYNDLEEEYEDLKKQTSELLLIRENDIKELQARLSSEKKRISTNDASTQYSFDSMEIRKIPNDKFYKFPNCTNIHSNVDVSSSIPTSHGSTVKKLFNHGINDYKIIDQRKIADIDESSNVSSAYSMKSSKIRDCYCQQIEAYNSMEELCRIHKAELHSLHQKKMEIDNECINLTKQKEILIKGVMELKNLTVVNRICPDDIDESSCNMSINVLKALNERLQVQERKRRNLKISLTHQQQQAEKILQQTWQQHCQEVAALRFALQGTNEQLKAQVQINQEQAERLAKADILSTDLYVQNAHLMASVKRLEHHCHLLAQFGGESTSV